MNKCKYIRVLLVEDSVLDQVAATSILEKELKCDVDIADTGAQAEKLVKIKNYDLIFMDIGLGANVPDGYALAEKILKNIPNHSDKITKIIALTSHGDNEDKEKSKAVGIHGFIAKPLTADKINQLLSKL